jgi:hypothetical protein
MPVTQFLHPRFALPRLSILATILASTLAATLCLPLHAQADKTITVLMLDGKTGRPIIPSNLLVRIDHLNAIHNEGLKLTDDGLGIVTVPASASFLSIQGAYESSMEVYVNCDASMEKDTSTLHWYSIADILTSGVSIPNECYKGKYAEATRLANKPGVFVVYVRKNNWHEVPADF